jgi:hypothetical protein
MEKKKTNFDCFAQNGVIYGNVDRVMILEQHMERLNK